MDWKVFRNSLLEALTLAAFILGTAGIAYLAASHIGDWAGAVAVGIGASLFYAVLRSAK